MSNLFDGYRKSSHDVVTKVMGENATWTPSAGGDQQSAKVLLNQPDKEYKIAGIEYSPTHFVMEYIIEYFVGLKYAADNGAANETVTVEGTDYFVKGVEAKYDGKTMLAVLEPIV